MAKLKISEFKKLINSLDEKGLREELLKLFKLEQVQAFYAQDLMTEEERNKILEDYKIKVKRQFWTPKGNPRDADNAYLRSIIAEFEKTAAFPYDVIDLLLHRVEMATLYAHSYGGMLDSEYNASITAFKKAVKLMHQHSLKEFFDAVCQRIFQYDNLDLWYIYELQDIYAEGI